jgi:hypothetical protein
LLLITTTKDFVGSDKDLMQINYDDEYNNKKAVKNASELLCAFSNQKKNVFPKHSGYMCSFCITGVESESQFNKVEATIQVLENSI